MAEIIARKKEVEIEVVGDDCSSGCSFYCESYTTNRCGHNEYFYYCALYDEGDIEDDKRVAGCLKDFGTV